MSRNAVGAASKSQKAENQVGMNVGRANFFDDAATDSSVPQVNVGDFAHTLQCFASTLRVAKDIGVVCNGLADVQAALLPIKWARVHPSEARTLELQYERFLEILLEQILPDWVPCMTEVQRARCFDALLSNDSMPPHHVFMAVCHTLCR
eukprot:SAG11_NODE_16772_length_538_cov_0.929385_1_plen_149_part_01